jgi:tRNA (Thr-GGU) A37 N-methylase
MRPNPIGVSVVGVQEVAGCELTVFGLDAVDGSPVIDIKAAPGQRCSENGATTVAEDPPLPEATGEP